jgi:WhiB family redox-sensing transcriptional regulator
MPRGRGVTKNSLGSRTRFLDDRIATAVALVAALPSREDAEGPATSGDPLPCHVEDPDLWFAVAPEDVERAKALCRGCPIRERCLAGALERRERWGVWGGQLLDHGTVVPRKRPRGRPRKTFDHPRPHYRGLHTTAAAAGRKES